MNFKINNQNTISNFYFENTEKESLGKEMCDQIESYINKTTEDFILFTLNNRLFLKIRILFSINSENITVYYWAGAPIYGNDNLESITKIVSNTEIPRDSIKWTKFYFKMKDPKDESQISLVSVFYDIELAEILTNNNYSVKKLIIEAPENEVNEISLEFNIARNSINHFNVIPDENSGDEQNFNLSVSKDDVPFIGLEEMNSIKIFKKEEIEDISNHNIFNYYKIQSCVPENIEQSKYAREIINKIDEKINDININNKYKDYERIIGDFSLREQISMQRRYVNYDMARQALKKASIDVIAGSTGEFGKVITNPIPVNGVLGELTYLSVIRCIICGKGLLFHRLGSLKLIDTFEVCCYEGCTKEKLYFDLYFPRRSTIIPKGFKLMDNPDEMAFFAPLFLGSHFCTNNFPYELEEEIKRHYIDKLESQSLYEIWITKYKEIIKKLKEKSEQIEEPKYYKTFTVGNIELDVFKFSNAYFREKLNMKREDAKRYLKLLNDDFIIDSNGMKKRTPRRITNALNSKNPQTTNISDLVSFLMGAGSDQSDRYIKQVLEMNDQEMEEIHDYIQWLFPLTEFSNAVPNSPILTDYDIEIIKKSKVIQSNLKSAMARMEQFYNDNDHWIEDHNHNHLRITRIIKSLNILLGYEIAEEFYYKIMARINTKPDVVSNESISYWKDALNVYHA